MQILTPEELRQKEESDAALELARAQLKSLSEEGENTPQVPYQRLHGQSARAREGVRARERGSERQTDPSGVLLEP